MGLSHRSKLAVVALLLFAGVAVAQSTLAQLRSGQTVAWSSAADGSLAPDLILQRQAAGILAQRNGVNAQEFRVYNTFTDASNGEWGALKWNSNTLEIGAYANGTGTTRNLLLRGNTDTINIGTGTVFLAGTLSSITMPAGSDLRANTFAVWTVTNPTLRWPNNSPDVSLYRTAAGVLSAGSGGTSGSGWLQNTAGRARLTANATNATATMSNLTDLSMTLIAGRKYTGRLVVFANNSTAAEGLQFDFNGGSATFTSIEFGFAATPPGSGLTLGTLTSTAAGTAVTATTATTADAVYTIEFTCVCNAAGTIIPRFAEVSHTSGTATVKLGSNFWLEDMPN